MKSKSSTIRLLYADSEKNADARYLSGVAIPDPFLILEAKGKRYGIVSQLEYARVASQSSLDEVLLLDTIYKKTAETLQIKLGDVGPGEMMLYFAQRFACKRVEVPHDFPSAFYVTLFDAGYKVKVIQGPFVKGRSIKSLDETKAIKKANSAPALGLRKAAEILKAASVEGNTIIFEGKALTSERLRTAINQACLERGATAANTIVAGGRQACDPHERGSGRLRANELIIIDVFPRDDRTGYHGDMTRTFLKGTASDEQRDLVNTVREAQKASLAAICAGVKSADVHEASAAYFREKGYKTERRGKSFVGFIHSTGHGLGLDVHEPPRVSNKSGRLKAGNVITVEPGLYYPSIGGCRIEDVVCVTDDGYDKLSTMHYRWEYR